MEIRTADDSGVRPHFLCHAASTSAAAAMAGRLMGSGVNVRGFDYYPLSGAAVRGFIPAAPPLGGWQEVRGRDAWDRVMAARMTPRVQQ